MTAESPTTELAPIVKRVEVRCSPDRAFEIFTASIGEWWPLATQSVYETDAASVTMDLRPGGAIVETSRSGETAPWGTITAWEPVRRVAFTWHPGLPLDEATDVEVRFAPSERGTIVELEHSGWERRREPAAKRTNYERGWDPVLASFVARADSRTDP
jgi:hypothetical protein